MINNGNKVISRGFTDNNKVDFEPYILRPIFNLVWGGDEVMVTEEDIREMDEDNSDKLTEKLLDRILESCSYISDRNKLFFPKLIGKGVNKIAMDDKGNLTAIGYSLQQVGVNIIKADTPFLDMDILKTKKLSF